MRLVKLSPMLDWISPFTGIQKTEVSHLSFSLHTDDVQYLMHLSIVYPRMGGAGNPRGI